MFEDQNGELDLGRVFWCAGGLMIATAIFAGFYKGHRSGGTQHFPPDFIPAGKAFPLELKATDIEKTADRDFTEVVCRFRVNGNGAQVEIPMPLARKSKGGAAFFRCELPPLAKGDEVEYMFHFKVWGKPGLHAAPRVHVK